MSAHESELAVCEHNAVDSESKRTTEKNGGYVFHRSSRGAPFRAESAERETATGLSRLCMHSV